MGLKDFHDNEMGIYFSPAWFPELSSNTLAVTQFFGTRRNVGTPFEFIEISHADIIVNYRDYDYVWDNSKEGNFGQFDLPSVIIHEMGHFLGLRHEKSDELAVMQDSLGRFHRYRDLYTPDTQAMQELYQNSELTTSEVPTALKFSPDESQPVRGILKLKADGTCVHDLNGGEIERH